MPPTRNPDVECFDDTDFFDPADAERIELDHDVTIQANPRVAIGFFIAWKNGALLTWGAMGYSPFPVDADTIALHPKDYDKLMALQDRLNAEEMAHGRA
jgi:hypothetical protein